MFFYSWIEFTEGGESLVSVVYSDYAGLICFLLAFTLFPPWSLLKNFFLSAKTIPVRLFFLFLVLLIIIEVVFWDKWDFSSSLVIVYSALLVQLGMKSSEPEKPTSHLD